MFIYCFEQIGTRQVDRITGEYAKQREFIFVENIIIEESVEG